jgi:hypothetical protein
LICLCLDGCAGWVEGRGHRKWSKHCLICGMNQDALRRIVGDLPLMPLIIECSFPLVGMDGLPLAKKCDIYYSFKLDKVVAESPRRGLFLSGVLRARPGNVAVRSCNRLLHRMTFQSGCCPVGMDPICGAATLCVPLAFINIFRLVIWRFAFA